MPTRRVTNFHCQNSLGASARPNTTEVAVEDARKYLLGRLPFEFITNERVGQQLLAIERYGLGLDYLDKYRKAVAAVTPADVQAAAEKYLDPKHMVLVAAGAIDSKGKPLPQKPSPRPMTPSK